MNSTDLPTHDNQSCPAQTHEFASPIIEAHHESAGKNTTLVKSTEDAFDSIEIWLQDDGQRFSSVGANDRYRSHYRILCIQLRRHIAISAAWSVISLACAFYSGNHHITATAIGYLIGTLFTAGFSQHAFVYSQSKNSA